MYPYLLIVSLLNYCVLCNIFNVILYNVNVKVLPCLFLLTFSTVNTARQHWLKTIIIIINCSGIINSWCWLWCKNNFIYLFVIWWAWCLFHLSFGTVETEKYKLFSKHLPELFRYCELIVFQSNRLLIPTTIWGGEYSKCCWMYK